MCSLPMYGHKLSRLEKQHKIDLLLKTETISIIRLYNETVSQHKLGNIECDW